MLGKHGAIYYKDIECLRRTANSAAQAKVFIDNLQCRNVDNASVYSVANEAIIEHGFGLSSIKGHTFNKSMKEYSSQKLKNNQDLIMKVSKTAFSQPVLKRKRYQEPLSANIQASGVLAVVKESLSKVPDDQKYTIVSMGYKEGLDRNQKLMVEALQILSAQPRKPNKSHWKQNFGHGPTVPVNEVCESGPLLQFKKGDVLATKNGLGGYNLLLVKSDVLFGDFIEDRLVVCIPLIAANKESFEFNVIEDSVVLNEEELLRDTVNDIFCFPSTPHIGTHKIKIQKKFIAALEKQIKLEKQISIEISRVGDRQ